MARKVLLADDSVTAQNMGRRILVDAGYEVITVNNGSSALKKVAESKPDLIVLDVYMPGYGGLEVCQRIRESQETARIPILLTVGKLEPFKAEEANRVRADGFIVKPFEAAELLAALTRLEDKIVPQRGSRRSGRGKASEDAAYANEFGNVETGWKNRLKIPPPHQPRPATLASRENGSEPEQIQDEQPPIGRDFNADEPQPIVEAAEEQPAASQAITEFAVGSEAVSGEESNFESRPEDEPPHETPPQPFALQSPPAHEDEVAAALASLVPANGQGSGTTAPEPEPVPVTMAAATDLQEFSGPRWIAQEVALGDNESSLILEQEMHKAFAALAAADAARMTLSSLPEQVPQTTSESQAHTSNEPEPNFQERASFASVSDKSEPAIVPSVPTDALAAADPTQVMVEPDAAQELSAYAAAAAAGVTSASREAGVEAAASQPSLNSVDAPSPSESRHDADLAAAWANWKQVRDSVSSPEFTSQIADAATTGFKEIGPEEPANPESETPTPAAEENGTISIIVDSVLAELKPKLVEEIAKKMKKKQK